MTLEELRKLAETSLTENVRWYEDNQKWASTSLVAAMSPATVLKLLEMIATYRKGMEVARGHLLINEVQQACDAIQGFYDRAGEIERSL